ncbi:hypothetical protein [Bounagaea algeriensis]
MIRNPGAQRPQQSTRPRLVRPEGTGRSEVAPIELFVGPATLATTAALAVATQVARWVPAGTAAAHHGEGGA